MGRRSHHLALPLTSPFLFIVLILSFSMLPMSLGAQDDFVRGDCLGDGNVELGDLVYMMTCVICDPGPAYCYDACDADDDGAYTISDPLYLLNYLFEGDVPPPPPFPTCGADPTADSLSCNNYQHDCQTPTPQPPLDSDYIFSIPDGEGAPGETIAVDVELEILDGDWLLACSFGVAHDPNALALTELLPGTATADVAWAIFDVRDGGWTGAIIVSVFMQTLWVEGTYPLVTARYQVLGEVGDVTALDFVDTLGEPPVRTSVVPEWGPEVTPSTVSGTITVSTAFRRGDVNLDGIFNIGDPIWDLLCLFSCFPACLDAHDSNDDGSWDIADPIYMLGYLFVGGPAPPPPFFECGADPTEDVLDCDNFNSCP
ncbi:MAG: hypothetical protein CMJ95_09805 [Planctomycetes bacterium]|nr:hypothetical protein [Planctomycetota bacterium]MAW77659.1 hypothetical protein [Planctomycetota bacterium]